MAKKESTPKAYFAVGGDVPKTFTFKTKEEKRAFMRGARFGYEYHDAGVEVFKTPAERREYIDFNA